MDFSSKQKDFCQRRTRFFGVKCPSVRQGKFVANLLLVRRLEIMSADWSKTTTQKGAKKSVLEKLMKFNSDILIARNLKYFCCDSKVWMQFLRDDGYQLTLPCFLVLLSNFLFHE